MGWIIDGLLDIFLSIAGDLITFVLKTYGNFDLDIGFSPDSRVIELFSPDYYNHATGLLDRIFPTVTMFLPLMQYVGYLLVLVAVVYKIFTGMLGPLGSTSEHPMKTVGKAIMAGIGVTYAFSFFTLFERGGNFVYQKFKSQYGTIMGWDLPNVTDFLTSPSRLFKDPGTLGIKDLGLGFLMFALLVALAVPFLKLVLESFERYVLLGVLFYTSPVAFSTLAFGDDRNDIFKKWVQMVASQFVLLMLNLFFIGMFYAGWITVFSPCDPSYVETLTNPVLHEAIRVYEGNYVFENGTDMAMKFFILIGWCSLGCKVDELMGQLGLSAARTGSGLGIAVLAGLHAGADAVKGTAKGIKNASHEVAQFREGAARQDMADRRQALMQKETGATINREHGLNTVDEATYKDNLSRDGSGHLTKEGIESAMFSPAVNENGEDIKFTDNDARDIGHQMSSALGESSTEGGVSCEYSDGLALYKDEDGNIVGSAWQQGKYEANDYAVMQSEYVDAGGNSHKIEGYMSQNDISNYSERMTSTLNASSYDGFKDITWENNGNGTACGYDSQGNVAYHAHVDGACDISNKYNEVGGFTAISLKDEQHPNCNATFTVVDCNNGQRMMDTKSDVSMRKVVGSDNKPMEAPKKVGVEARDSYALSHAKNKEALKASFEREDAKRKSYIQETQGHDAHPFRTSMYRKYNDSVNNSTRRSRKFDKKSVNDSKYTEAKIVKKTTMERKVSSPESPSRNVTERTSFARFNPTQPKQSSSGESKISNLFKRVENTNKKKK